MKKIPIFLLILGLVFFSLSDTLRFGLNGDDWFTLWRYLRDFTSFSSHFEIKNYASEFSTYVPANVIMGIIYRLFSFNPFPYYLISMILKAIAAISFYPAVFAAIKDKKAAILSAIFFSCLFAGIETTNWVFNMNTYISLILLNLFFYFYYSKEFSPTSSRGIVSGLILGASFIIAQNRMHGLLFVIPLIVVSKLKFNRPNLGKIFFTLLSFYFPILAYRFITRSTQDTTYTSNIVQSVTHFPTLLFSLLSSIGNSLIPDKVYTYFNISENLKVLFSLFVLGSLLFFIFKKFSKSEKFNFSLISFSLPLLFLIVPLLVYGSPAPLPSEHRYLLIPTAFLYVSLAIFFSYFLESKKRILKVMSIFFVIVIILTNFLTLRKYFNYLSVEGRLAEDSKRHFQYLKLQVQNFNPNAPVVFLLIPDAPFYLYNSITFGLTYHLMLVDSRFSFDFQKSPFPADNMDSLIDVLSGPESKELKRYGYNPVQIPLENVYAFNLQNKNLTNITPQVREYLKEKLPHLKKVKN